MLRILSALLLLTFSSIVSAQTILVLGDSLSAAYGMPAGQGWVSLLEKRLQQQPARHQVINASISGDTTASGLARLPQALSAHQPDILIVALGANDGLRGLSLQHMKDNLSQMIELADSQGAHTVLAGMHMPPNYGPFYTREFHAVYQNLADEYAITLIPFLLDQVGAAYQLIQADGLHPNAAAQPQILETVWTYLAPLLQTTPQAEAERPKD